MLQHEAGRGAGSKPAAAPGTCRAPAPLPLGPAVRANYRLTFPRDIKRKCSAWLYISLQRFSLYFGRGTCHRPMLLITEVSLGVRVGKLRHGTEVATWHYPAEPLVVLAEPLVVLAVSPNTTQPGASPSPPTQGSVPVG